MKPLTERMTKGGAAKAWIKEVEAKDREIERLEQTKDQYLNTINLLACEKEELEAGKDRLLEQLVAGEELYISRGIEIAHLEAKLSAIECAGCEKTLLECTCDDENI